MQWWEILFPRKCLGCGQLFVNLCPDCINLLSLNKSYFPKSPYLDGLTAPLQYKGLSKKLITKLKYSFVTDLLDDICEVVFSLIDLSTISNDKWLVTGVPLHTQRLKWRGFNQADEIAKRIAAYLDWPYAPDLLKRHRYTTPQMSLNKKHRQQNLTNAFSSNKPSIIKNHNILLVDDVWTTGTTMTECAKVLKKAHAKKVWGLCIAKA